jgi:hypothetical protein
MRYIIRWQKIAKNTPAFQNGYKWFDAQTMRHYTGLPITAIFQPFTRYSFIKHG